MASKFAVAFGEPFDAIDFFGPFDCFDDAEDWADCNNDMRSWWIIKLNDPTL